MRAKDIMHRQVITATGDMTLGDVARLMSANRISGLPIIDGEGCLLGIITDSDILRYRQRVNLPDCMKLLEYFIEEIDPGGIEREIREILQKKAKEVMTTRVITVGENSRGGEIISKLAENHIGRLPVVRGKKLVGLVAREDVVKALAEGY